MFYRGHRLYRLEPTYPKSNMIILANTYWRSALLSVIMALVAEGWRERLFEVVSKRCNCFKFRTWRYVPIIPKSWIGPRLDPIQEILKRPQLGFAISMRSLYLACRLPKSDRSHHVIMLTSCLPGEGKTKLSIGLAATAAADGRKTALVDLNGHNCRILKTLNLEAASRSLDSFLSGECGLSDIICQSPDLQGLSVISSPQSSDPSAFLGSDRLRQLVWRCGLNLIIHRNRHSASIECR